MAVINSVPIRTTTLGAIKRAGSSGNSAEEDNNRDKSQSPTVISMGTQTVNTQTTVTTVVLTNGNSNLPNLSLEDVLERSGVEQSSQISIETIDVDTLSGMNYSSAELIDNDANTLRTVVDSIETADAVVVEVETTNNVQTVKVRATDIEAAYTHASAQAAGTPINGFANFLLLRNGWAYTALESSPLDLPVEPPNQQAGDDWAPWRILEDGAHEIQDIASGAWNRLVGQLVDTSPKPLSELAGVFKHSSTDEHLLSTVTSSDTLELSSDGIFTSTRSILASNGLLSTEAGFVSHTVHSAKGSSTTVSNDQTISNASATTDEVRNSLNDVADDMFGSYRLLEDGMTLELSYADGSSERRLFLNTVSGTITIDGKAYYRAADASPYLLDNLLALLMTDGETDKRGEWLKSLADAMRQSADSQFSSKTLSAHSESNSE
ncbi:MAG: hypothetical protein AB8B87_09180 [Granulosicoccus sp.]